MGLSLAAVHDVRFVRLFNCPCLCRLHLAWAWQSSRRPLSALSSTHFHPIPTPKPHIHLKTYLNTSATRLTVLTNLVIDLATLYPASLTPSISTTLRTYYTTTYADRFFTRPPLWFTAYMYLELIYHLPVSLWFVWNIPKGMCGTQLMRHSRRGNALHRTTQDSKTVFPLQIIHSSR